MYKYFVSYFFQKEDGSTGFGDICEIPLSHNPPTSQDIKLLESSMIECWDVLSVVILNIVLLSDEQ